ncbi:prepilin-type N-terminal cleavage/methylation domain-containing protein [Sphingomonas sp. CL5.1]|uniref:GspH/FimT family pseudopilin n=1 Tax=Sphingomonas sp. CL5.1 TaxID=2653203 RepID=UPI001583D82C|nr:GspH/FimT family pseudopilin [Sphingomonas sp. CL5.1]QKS01276.1 prepilin-type N-terminal cleavage/methylation domain-containing protein [Sphingomonas sp. CL5.1]
MAISAPGNSYPGRSAGFTLIELMVVMLVIALATAAAVLAMPDPRGRVIDEAARFALRVRAARDGAIVDARPVSVWVTPGGYGFDRWEGGRWVAMDEKPLTVAQWGRGTTATIGDRLRVTFDATGMADRPAAIPLLRERARATVTIDPTGAVRVDG